MGLPPGREAVSLESLRQRWVKNGRAWGEGQYDPAARLLRFPAVARDGSGPDRHMTRDSLYYARILLDGRADADAAVAAGIIEAVVAVQVTREGSPVRGNFPWAAEAAEQEVWDPNWAAFNAQTLLELLHWHRTRLPAGVVAAMERALALCAEHDLARWVSPAYTNVALLSTLSMAAGGDWLRDAKLAAAGRDKLTETWSCVMATQGFEEYNSPTYAAVNLRALSSLLAFLKDEESLARVRALFRLQWRTLLDHLHPASGQLAGPHGRAYGRDLLRHTHGIVKFYLHRALGQRFPVGVEIDGTASDLFPAMIFQDPDCPDDLRDAWVNREGSARTVTEVVDSCTWTAGLPEFRRFPPFWRSRAGRDAWARLVESKGKPGTPGFRGSVQAITTYLAPTYCLGTASADVMGDQTVPLIAHWPQEGRTDRVNYFAALVLTEREGKLDNLHGAVVCCAQREHRALGLVRFEPDPEDRTPPSADRVVLAFQVNADAEPEIVAHGASPGEEVNLQQGVIFRSSGVLCGVRIIQARVPGAKVGGTIRDLPAPFAPAEGETGAHLILEPVRLTLGQEAYVAFAVEVCTESAPGGVAGLASRLMTARVAADRNADGWVRLVWGADLALETSTRVSDCKGWLTAEGEVRTT